MCLIEARDKRRFTNAGFTAHEDEPAMPGGGVGQMAFKEIKS